MRVITITIVGDVGSFSYLIFNKKPVKTDIELPRRTKRTTVLYRSLRERLKRIIGSNNVPKVNRRPKT